MGKKKKTEEKEYVPKKRCSTEGCLNRQIIGKKCLSCHYSEKKNKIDEKARKIQTTKES